MLPICVSVVPYVNGNNKSTYLMEERLTELIEINSCHNVWHIVGIT